MNMVEFRQNLESGPTGSGRPRPGHPRPQPILKPGRWTFSCCTPAMSPPTPEDEPHIEATTPMPSPPASSTTAAAVDETPPNAAARATSPSDAATRAAYLAAADFDEDVPLPGEILTREELEFYSDVREDAPASPGDMLAGLPSWLDDDHDEEEEQAVTEPAATYRDVGEEPTRADDADGESPDAERGAEGGADQDDDDDDDFADVSVAELLDSESDAAFAFRPSSVASATFRGVLYGNYAPVGDDETLGTSPSSSFEVERERDVGEERDPGRRPSTPPRERDPSERENLDDPSGRGTAAAVAELWSDVRDARAARERRVSDMRAFLRRVRAGDDGVDRRVKFPPSPAPTDPMPNDEAGDPASHRPVSHRPIGAEKPEPSPSPGPARVAAVSPRVSTTRALEDRDWSPMLPTTRVGLQRLIDGDAAVVRAFEGEEGEGEERGIAARFRPIDPRSSRPPLSFASRWAYPRVNLGGRSRRRENRPKKEAPSKRKRRTRRDTPLEAPWRPVGARRWPRRRRMPPDATRRTRRPTFSGGVSAGPDRSSRRPRRDRRFARARMRDARRAFWSGGGRGEREAGGRGASPPRRGERRRRKRRRRPGSRGDYARGERTRPTGKSGARRPRASASRLGTSRRG